MARNTQSSRDYIRERWRVWLASHKPSISATALARCLADEDTSKDSQPRAMVYAWLLGERIPKSTSVWRAGEALRSLDYADCGPLSLYAGGYHDVAILVLDRLAKRPQGARAAATLACALPLAADLAIEDQLAIEAGADRVLDASAPFREGSRLARELCRYTAEGVSSGLADIWPDSQSSPSTLSDGVDDLIRVAHIIATADIRPGFARGLSWPYIVDWAERHHDGYDAWAKYHWLVDLHRAWRLAIVPQKASEEWRYIRLSRKRGQRLTIDEILTRKESR